MGETYPVTFENAGRRLTYLGVLEKRWNRITLFPYDGDLSRRFWKCWNMVLVYQRFKDAGIGLLHSLMIETYRDTFESAVIWLTYLSIFEKRRNRSLVGIY